VQVPVCNKKKTPALQKDNVSYNSNSKVLV
jgi:hypothetical protein